MPIFSLAIIEPQVLLRVSGFFNIENNG